MEQDLSDFVTQLSPQAMLDSVSLGVTDKVTLEASLSDMSWKQVDYVPGIQGLNASLSWFDQHGVLTITDKQGVVESSNLLETDLNYQQLALEARFAITEQGFELHIPQFEFESDLLDVSKTLKYTSVDNWLSVSAQINPMPLAQAKQLFSDALIGKQTRSYLERALVSGSISESKYTLGRAA